MTAEKDNLFLFLFCTGEELYPHVQSLEPDLAPNITGMLLELPESEVIALIGDQLACRDKVHAPLSCCSCQLSAMLACWSCLLPHVHCLLANIRLSAYLSMCLFVCLFNIFHLKGLQSFVCL